jgi:hypothetical protein
MGGEETVRKLRALDPGVRAVVSSGYSDHPVLADPRRYGFVARARKPYTLSELGRVLEEAFGADLGGVSGAEALEGIE